MSEYAKAIRNLNGAANEAIRASRDTTKYPLIDRHSLRLIARETDRLVNFEENSGEHLSHIGAFGESEDYPAGWMGIDSAPIHEDSPEVLVTDGVSMFVKAWREDDDGDMNWCPRTRGFRATHWMPLPNRPKTQEGDPQ